MLGYYDPMKSPRLLKMDLERVDHWISQGAQPTDTVKMLIARARTGEPWFKEIKKPAPPAPEPVEEVEAAVEAAPAEEAVEAAPAEEAVEAAPAEEAVEAAPAEEAAEAAPAEEAAEAAPAEETPADGGK
jgi:small subunit ribosomal protein S16